MSKRVADLLVEAPQAASAKNRYEIVGDTLNRIVRANDRCERGAPRRMTFGESEGGLAGERRWAPTIEASRRPSAAARPGQHR
jgi:hypothetical protein